MYGYPEFWAILISQGEMLYSDNTRYLGGWKKDKRKGFGVFIEKTHEKYYGEWIRGKVWTAPFILCADLCSVQDLVSKSILMAPTMRATIFMMK